MKAFVKHFIGKGKKVKNLEIVKVTVKLEDLEKFAYLYDGIKYVSFEVAKMKAVDSFGRDHTVYVTEREDSPVANKPEIAALASVNEAAPEAQTVSLEEEIPF
jgi:hypothetical protein